jgi:hypothetical protein
MRGTVILKAGEDTHELRFTTNALCWLEEVTGKPVAEAMQSLGGASVRMTDLRLLVCAAAGFKDPASAGDLIDAAGITATMEALARAVEAAFPDAEASAKKTVAAA